MAGLKRGWLDWKVELPQDHGSVFWRKVTLFALELSYFKQHYGKDPQDEYDRF